MNHHTRIAAIIGTALLALPSLAFAAFGADLQYGARGSAVIELQQFLIGRSLLATENASGYFGPLTLAAVKTFQASQGVQPVSGFFGPFTRAKAMALAGGVVIPSGAADTAAASKIVALFAQVQQLQAQIAALKNCPDCITSSLPTSSVSMPASCAFNNQAVAHGASVSAYQASTVPAGQT